MSKITPGSGHRQFPSHSGHFAIGGRFVSASQVKLILQKPAFDIAVEKGDSSLGL
jgi:hypothetical protein